MRLLPRLVAGIVLVCIFEQDASARPGQDKWWQDPAIQQELALTAEQVRTLEWLFASTQMEQRSLGKALARLERSLQHAIAAADLDDEGLGHAVDEVEAMRAKRNTTRALRLYRMYRTLSPEQRQQLRAIQKVGERRRRASDLPAGLF